MGTSGILLGLIVTVSNVYSTVGVSLEQASSANADVLTLEFLSKIDTSLIRDSYLMLEISKTAYEIKFSDLKGYLYMTEEERFYQNTMVGQFADQLQDLSCEQLSCQERSVCYKFDTSRIFPETDAIIIANWALRIPETLRHGLEKVYSHDNVHYLVKALINIHYPNLYSMLTEKEVPESIVPYLNEDGNPEVNAAERTILEYVRFYIAKAYYMKGLETLIQMVSAKTREQVTELVSGEVSCRKPSIADVFDKITKALFKDSTFMDKLDHATLFSPEAGRKVVDLAKDIHVFTIHDFYQANKDYQEEQKKAIISFNVQLESFTCEILRCVNCRHPDACHVLTADEKAEILTIIAFPPQEVLNSFSLKYDAKSTYFSMKDIFDLKVPGALYENIKKAFDIDHNGVTNSQEMEFVDFVWFVLDYYLAHQAITVMRDVVFAQTRDEMEGYVTHQAYCLSADAYDSLFSEAINSSLLQNHELIRHIIESSKYFANLTPGDYFHMSQELKDECLENLRIFINDFHRLLCDNYPCQYGGKCSVRLTLEMITVKEHELVYELITQPDTISISVMPESFKEHLLKFTDAMLRGEFGDPLLLMDAMKNEEFVPFLDVSENLELEEDEVNIGIYANLRFRKYLCGKIMQTIVHLVNAKLPYLVDETLRDFVGCQCSVGFGGEHCNECKVPEWLVPNLYVAPHPLIL